MPNLKNSAAWAKAANRWMTAPVVVEGYGNTGMTYSTAVSQVLDFNISSIGNGNFEYILEMLVTDASQYYDPLRIAIQGGKVNGAYPLGLICIN